MCTKSKTTFGCGHYVKVTEPCEIPSCTTLDKWKFPAYKDCPQCKAAGTTINRGKEGKGRHGIEIKTREERRSSPWSSAPSSPSAPAHLSISPWAADRSTREKKWDTPTRQKADAAWLVEHERRISDLEESTSKMSLRSRRDSISSSARSSYERVIEADEVEEPEELDMFPTPSRVTKLLPYEVSRVSDSSRSRRRSPKHSQSSERSPSHHHELVLRTPRRSTHHYDTAMSEYPESPSNHQMIRRSRKTKTEPYYAQSCSYEPAVAIVSGSVPLPHEQWMPQYESVQPFQHDNHYPRTYPVY